MARIGNSLNSCQLACPDKEGQFGPKTLPYCAASRCIKPTAVAEWAGLLSGFRPDCCPVIPVRRMLDGTGPCWRMLAILRPFELAIGRGSSAVPNAGRGCRSCESDDLPCTSRVIQEASDGSKKGWHQRPRCREKLAYPAVRPSA